jgi:hypothetical protein
MLARRPIVRLEFLVVAAAAALLAGLSAGAAAGAGGEHGLAGLLGFREDGNDVGALGLVVMGWFFAGVALTCGSLAGAGRERTLTAVGNASIKVTLLIAVIFMFAFPDLSQFENKSLTLRAVFYPLLALAPYALYRVRGAAGRFPTVLDLCLSFALTFDIVSNDLHWYGRWTHWDDFIHFVNSVPLMVLIVAPLLLLERRGIIRLGFWGAVLFALTIYTSLHAVWEMYEFFMDRFAGTELQPGGMEEATRNNVAGLAGSFLGVMLLWWWQRIGSLEDALARPLEAYLTELRQAASRLRK